MSEKVLEIKDLHVAYRTDDAIVRAVNGLSLSIEAGETVGQSGAAKLLFRSAGRGLRICLLLSGKRSCAISAVSLQKTGLLRHRTP